MVSVRQISALVAAANLLLVLPSCADPENPPDLRGLDNSQTNITRTLDELRTDSEETAGAMFLNADQVLVKPPVLKALIQLQNNLSPYELDAMGKPIDKVNLREVVKGALDQNLDIKIAHSDEQSERWNYYSALGGFLPNLQNGVIYQSLAGKFASAFGTVAPVDSPFLVIPATANYYFFQGGKVVFGSAEAKHKYKASQFALKGATNDVLLDASKLYYDLVLNDVLLQIRVKAVETSEALLARDEIRHSNGAATQLDVLQARSQLSKDRQALISQQIARRKAAVHLATSLNWDTGTDLESEDRLLSKIRLIDSTMSIADLLTVAIDSRPELKEREQLRLAAKDAVRVARAKLLPTVQGSLQAITTGANSNPIAAAVPDAAGGGAVAPAAFTGTGVAPGGAAAGLLPVKFRGAELFSIAIDVEWTLGGLGTIDAAKVQSAKWVARKEQLEFNRRLEKVYGEVRDAYLDSIEAENLIKETTEAVNAAREELRVATTRLDEGVGTDLDVVNAQREYTTALINKADAIVKFDTSQIDILRAIGKISFDTVTRNVPFKS